MKFGDGHFIFNGQSRLLKLFVYGEDSTARHVWPAHDVGVNDNIVMAGEDVYGHYCKCPPGTLYTLGEPQSTAPGEAAYGFWFTPIFDNAAGTLVAHGRADLGIHGGGSGLPDPFAPYQGWYYTLGCIRLQNVSNGMIDPAPGTFVASVQYIQKHGGTCYLDVVWP